MKNDTIDTALRDAIDGQALVGASYAVIRNGEVVATHWLGHADREAGIALREDHIFRAFKIEVGLRLGGEENEQGERGEEKLFHEFG